MGITRWKFAQFFELRWWKNYLKGKSPNDYLEWKRQYWLEFLQSLELNPRDIAHPAIDIGCGPAGIFMVLKENVTAVDPLLESYEDLAIFNRSDYSQVHFVNASFEDFQSGEKYASVFCLNAINHFIDMEASFKKLGAICATNGQLIISIDAHNHSVFRKLFSWIPLDVLHPHQYTLEEYQAFIETAGFSIEKKVLNKKRFFFDYWVLSARKTS